jgi:hypothetical protein
MQRSMKKKDMHVCESNQGVSFFSRDETYTKGRIIEVFLEKVFGC